MKKHLSKALRFALSCTLTFLALTTAGYAQTTTFTYQGSLTLGGTLASGSYDLQFKLYDQLSGGTLQGSPLTVTVSGVAVTGGVFSVELDFGATAFPGAARYLEISVRSAGSGSFTTLSPRQQLTSTPYAIRSLSAASADTATTAASATTATTANSATTATNATNFTGSLAGDVTGTQSATVVSMVGGVTASNVASGATAANNATNANTPSAIVKRDASGNFTAGTITATAFSGGGANLTNLNASNIATGSLLDSLLSSNVAKLNTAQTFTANQTINANLIQSGTLVQFTPTNGFVAGGTVGSGSIPATGAGARLMWYPNKAAFRAGQVSNANSTYWDDANIGIGSAAFGEDNRASGKNSFAAGLTNTASGDKSVALGESATASSTAAIALGSEAQATSDYSLALGPSAIAQGLGSIALGPCTASGSFSTCIGLRTKATGSFSTIIGRDASSSSDSADSTIYSGVIALGDASTNFSTHTMYATANNQFNVRAAGGIRFFTACCNYDTGVTVSAGGGAWNSISDRNAKENFQPVAPRDILHRVLRLPISTWNYKAQNASIRHIGAMAQDFYAAFKVGDDDKHISTIDPDGVALAAIQGLHEELKDRDAKIEQQQQQLNQLQEQIKQQQAAIEGMRQLVCAQTPQAELCRKR